MLCNQNSDNLLDVDVSGRCRLARSVFDNSNIDNFVYKDGVLLWSVGNILCDWKSYREDCAIYFPNVNCCDKWLFSVHRSFSMNNSSVVESVDSVNKKEFLSDLSRFVRRSIPACQDTYCTRSNGVKVNAYALFNCKDLNQFASASFVSKNFDKPYNAKWRVGTKMRGRTQLGRHGFAFPVICTRREFISFIEQMLDVSSTERKALFQDGVVLTPRVEHLYSRVFPKGALASPYALEREDIFNGVSALSSIILFLEAAHKKDTRTLGLLCMQHINIIAPVAEYMGSALADFKDDVVKFLYSATTFGDGDDDRFPWISLLPGVARQSVLVQRTIALATFMMSARFVTDSSIWQYLVQLIGPSFDSISPKAKGAALFVGVVSALWEGFSRMKDFTDVRSLLGMSKDGAFTESVNELKLMREGALSDAEASSLINRIDGLLASRQGLVNSAAISRMCDFLVEKKKEVIRYTQDYKPREKPIVIWINGPPGSGKTTFIEGLKNFLANKDGVPRKLGDTVMYYICDKYPAEMAHNFDARYVDINDIPANYVEFAKEGKVPLDLLLQQVIDTSPLSFQAAFKKGIIYNNIKYVFITSNHKGYKFAGDIEKLQRRLEDSILLHMGFGNGSYADVAKHDVLLRNDYLRFNTMKAQTSVTGTLTFIPSPFVMEYKDIIPYIEEKVDKLCAERAEEHVRFNTAVCTCGMARAHHLVKGKPVAMVPRCDLSSMEETDSDNTVVADLISLEERAHLDFHYRVNEIATLPYGTDRTDTIVAVLGDLIPDLFTRLDRLYGKKHMRDKTLRNLDDLASRVDPEFQSYVTQLVELFNSDFCSSIQADTPMPYTVASVPEETAVVPEGDLLTFESEHPVQPYGLLLTCVGTFGIASLLYSYAPRLSYVQSVALWIKLCTNLAIYHFIVKFVCTYMLWKYGNPYEVRQYVIYYKLQTAITKIRLFIANNSVAIAGLGLTALFGYTVSNRQSDRPNAEVRGVTRLNYDANSLTTSVMKTEQMMQTSNRSWTRDGPINVVKLQTHNVYSEDLRTKVQRAVLKARFAPTGEITDRYRAGHIFVLSSSVIIVNRHYLVDVATKEFIDVIVYLEDGTAFVLHKDDYMCVPNVEAVAVNCTKFLDKENLSKFLPTALPNTTSYDAIYVPTGEKVVATGAQVVLQDNYGTYPGIACRLRTERGDCGNVLLGTINGNAFIAGLLFAGEPTPDSHITYFTPIPAAPHVAPRVIIPEPADLGPIDAGSEIANDPHGDLRILGTNPAEGKQGFRTAFRESRLYPFVHEKLSETYHFPLKISGNVSLDPKTYVHGSAWQNTFKHFDMVNLASNTLFFNAVVAYVEGFPKEGPLAPLTLEQAIFGEPSIGVEGFPLNTSAGPYWRKFGVKKKRDLFTENAETGLYEVLPEFRDAVEKQLEMLDEHVVVAPHVEMAAKDEIRPTRKLNEYKVRLFSVVDADYNVVIRMYVMPLIVYLMKHKTHSECYGQMHAASKQWTDLKNYLTEPGFTKFADMDFTSFDTCHDDKVFRAVALVLYLLAGHVGYSLEDALKVRTLVESMSVQLTQYKGDYFVKTKGMPSGVILTLIMNSIANSLLMRVVYGILTELPVDTFRNNVRLATVGDDNIHSFSDSIADSFTMTRAKEVYEKLGYVITPAAKEGEFVDAMALEDLVFVKRKFVLWDDGFYRAPLDTDSIYKSFCFERKSGPEDSVERLKSVYGSGVREAYLHGREFFDNFVEFMSDLYQKHDLPYERLSFDELNKKFLEEGLITGDA